MTPQELKASILQLAIQGKLVEQRAEEGTTEALYQQIQQKKQRLIMAGTIKKEKPLPEIAEDEIPFDIPASWRWIRLGDYAQKITDQVASGSFAALRQNVPSLKEPDYAIMVKTADFANGFTRNLTYTTQHGYEFLENSNLFGGELVLSNIGSIGKCFIVPHLQTKMTLAPNAVMIRLVDEDLRDYLYYFIHSAQGYQALLSITSGTAMKKFNKTDLKTVLVPVPPLAEQKRIVAKIEELLPYIDRYEQAWSRLEDFNRRFPVDMQKSILQMAIQGKLVEQRPEEGTGEELYQQIQQEKQRLIKAGTIKKEKPLPEITEDEIPFDIPEGWKWVRIGTLLYKLVDGTHRTPKYTESGIPFVSVRNMSSGKLSLIDTKFISVEEHRELWQRCNPERNDILLSKVGTTGVPAKVDTDIEFSLFVSVALLKFNTALLDIDFLVYSILAPDFQKQCKEHTRGVGNKNWVIQDIANTIMPLPPLAEQKRIVAKLEELLPLSDKLKRQTLLLPHDAKKKL